MNRNLKFNIVSKQFCFFQLIRGHLISLLLLNTNFSIPHDYQTVVQDRQSLVIGGPSPMYHTVGFLGHSQWRSFAVLVHFQQCFVVSKTLPNQLILRSFIVPITSHFFKEFFQLSILSYFILTGLLILFRFMYYFYKCHL